ncbi:MAG: J domain-containing protein [Chthoniobacterales bacterium]|nr:J domain-containing protein [Chthoniobacterales bacterium]
METSPADHYGALGLDPRCSSAQIRTAYRLLVKQHHPDIHGGSAAAIARAQELNIAHEILSDPALRRAYDDELNRAAETARAPHRGRIQRNIDKDVRLRIEDFFRGAHYEIHVTDPASADQVETYELHVPAGSAPGTRWRLPRTAPFENGFVIVRLCVLSGARFKVRGSDVRTDLRISSRRATDGGVESIHGPNNTMLRLPIPPRVKRGEVLRIVGEGLPHRRGGRGDLLVRVTYKPEVRVVRSRHS